MFKNNLQIITLNKVNVTDFAEARNTLLKKAKSEWVLFLDSDEKMSPGFLEEAKEAISESGYDGYYITRKNFFKEIPVGTDKILRLAKKNSGKWERAVHETWRVNGTIGNLNNPIIHESAGSIGEYLNKINKYAQLHAKANSKEGKNSGLIKIIIYPKLKFIESMLKGRGTVFSIMQAFHSFLSWSELWLIQKK